MGRHDRLQTPKDIIHATRLVAFPFSKHLLDLDALERNIKKMGDGAQYGFTRKIFGSKC